METGAFKVSPYIGEKERKMRPLPREGINKGRKEKVKMQNELQKRDYTESRFESKL